jgi:hypothetical protein
MEKTTQSQILNVSGSSFSDLCLVAKDTPPFKDADDRRINSGKDKELDEGGKDAPRGHSSYELCNLLEMSF